MRLFVAAPVPSAVRDHVSAAIAEAIDDDRLAWTRPEGWHATLAFVGEVDDLDAVVAGVRGGAVGGPVTVTTGPVDVMARGTALVVGLQDAPDGGLARLGHDIQQALVTGGIDVHVRRVRPHLTLGRARGRRRVPRGLRDDLAIPTTSWTVDRVEVVESILGRGPAVYRTRAEVPLAARG